MAKHLTTKLTFSPTSIVSFTNMPWIPPEISGTRHPPNHSVSQYSLKCKIHWDTKASTGLISSSNGSTTGKKRTKIFTNTLQTVPSAKEKRWKHRCVYCRLSTLQQNSHSSHHRSQYLYIRKATHYNYNWPFDGMSRRFAHSWQKYGHFLSMLLSSIISPSTCVRDSLCLTVEQNSMTH